MNEQTLKLIENLSIKFGTTAEHLYGVMVKQASISSTTTLVNILIGYILSIIIFRIGRKLNKENPGDIGEALSFVSVLFSVIVTFFLMGFSGSITSGYINPEYWAIKQLIK